MAETEATGKQPETEEAPSKGVCKDPFYEFKNEAEGHAVALHLYATSLLMIFENMEKSDFESLERMESVWYLIQQVEWRRQEFDQTISERVIPLREKAGIFAHPSVREARNG